MKVNQASNAEDLNRILLPKLKDVVNYVVQKLWNENRETIRQVVYEAYQPMVYERTDEFRNAWRTETNMSLSGHNIQGKLSYDPDLLTTIDETHHRTQMYLAEIIYEGLAGDFIDGYAKDNLAYADQAWARKRNAYLELEKKVGKRKLRQWMEEGLKISGLSYKWHNTAIKQREV